MKEFTYENWRKTLILVFERAAYDRPYRERCLTDPRGAVAEVSDIEIPPHYRFDFVAREKDVFNSVLLPPTVAEKDARATSDDLIVWALSTHPTMGPRPPH